jgi:GAF domain-containing protein/HAMP domain-containing protein
MPPVARPRGRLFRKYVLLFAGLVSGVLLASGLVELYFSYRENLAALVTLQREQAAGAAGKIEAFLRDIERQVGWASQGQVGTRQTVEQRRFEFIRLQRQVPAVTEVSQLDRTGREQLRVSRLAMDVVGSQTDFSADSRFKEVRPGRPYFGPVYFRKESEPYLTLSVAGGGDTGVTTAEVNLKFIWDVVSQIRIGPTGRAYVVDGRGQLVAHPDISLVLQNTNLSRLAQVEAALAGPSPQAREVTVAQDFAGRQVLTASAPIAPLGWWVFVEQPLGEALAPLYASAFRTVGLLLAGVALSVLASLLLARRIATPIQALEAGAARIGAGALDQRIDVKTGDELEGLADQFNRMATQLQESYATLEQKVEDRTRELSESLEQQTATAEILRVISSSPTDIQPVLDAVAVSATRLCDARDVSIALVDHGVLKVVASHGLLARWWPDEGVPISRGSVTGRAVVDRQTVHVHDLASEAEEEFPEGKAYQRTGGHRTNLAVPLLKEGTAIGVVAIRREEVRPFTDRQVRLLQTFADQAVIAIENVRLFQELEARNRDLSEALEQQTATGEILRVISSSPTDIQPTFEAIAASAVRLCESEEGTVFRFDGSLIHMVAHHGGGPRELEVLRGLFPAPPSRGLVTARSILTGAVVQADISTDPEHAYRELAGFFRTVLSVPMLRDGVPIGAIAVNRREGRPFSSKQIELLETFAAQAVIAIENVRLFQELDARNRELSEALEQQTATAEILRVISSSPTDLAPVFDTILDKACALSEAQLGAVFRLEGEVFDAVAWRGVRPEFAALLETREYRIGRPMFRPEGPWHPVHIADVTNTAIMQEPLLAEIVRIEGVRTVLGVPLVREGRMVGSIMMYRREVRPFTDKQIELVSTFATQAVIAIQNARLFQELESRTRELARSVEQLQALGAVGQAVSSTLDIETVLTTIVSRADLLAGADGGAIYEYDEARRVFHLRATQRLGEELVAATSSEPIRLGEGALGRAAQTRQPVEIPDVLEGGAYEGRMRELVGRTDFRAVLAVPLVREGRILGGLVVLRKTPGRFAPEVVDLLKTLAAQSAIAIQNARLFQALEEKSQELEAASRHKSEFLANMSHELRTPLNAIIGFSEVLGERMFGELNDKQAEYVEDILSSGRHLLALINDILDLSKVEAGRMELELTRFDLPAAIGSAVILVRERATRHGLALEVSVDDRLGLFVGDERKIRQVLLNLLSNAVKFTPEGGRIAVRAAPADGTAEVSVSDTGIGIAPEDQEAIFQEFRQVGTDYARKREGTGLGLALARRFVDLHGGRIWVKSRLGEGSTFTFTLPVRPWPAS